MTGRVKLKIPNTIPPTALPIATKPGTGDTIARTILRIKNQARRKLLNAITPNVKLAVEERAGLWFEFGLGWLF